MEIASAELKLAVFFQICPLFLPLISVLSDRSLVPALRRPWQADLYESEATLVYRPSSRAAKVIQQNPVLKKQGKSVFA